MRVGVIFLAVCVFLAALIFDTGALIRLPFACAAGGCGPHAKWVLGAIAAGLVVLLAAAVLAHRQPPRAAPRRAELKRKPGPRRKQRAARVAK